MARVPRHRPRRRTRPNPRTRTPAIRPEDAEVTITDPTTGETETVEGFVDETTTEPTPETETPASPEEDDGEDDGAEDLDLEPDVE